MLLAGTGTVGGQRRPPLPKAPKPKAPLPGANRYSFYTPGSTGANPLGAAANPAAATLPGNTTGQTPATTTPPTPIDYGALAQSDPTYLAQVAQAQKQIGWADPSGVWHEGAIDYAYNDPSNPNNTVTRLANLLKQNTQTINDTANAHGILFSGINVQGKSNEAEADKARVSAASVAHDAAIQNIKDTLGVDLGAATSRAIASMAGTLAQNTPPPAQQATTAAKATKPTKPAKAPSSRGGPAKTVPLRGANAYSFYTPRK